MWSRIRRAVRSGKEWCLGLDDDGGRHKVVSTRELEVDKLGLIE